MSYGLQTQCSMCAKRETCTDEKTVQAGITNVHETSYDDGHKGGGNIIIQCFNMEQIK